MADMHLRTSLLSDALDRAGRRRQCLGPDVVPLSGTRLEGRAFPFLLERVQAPAETLYVGLLRAVDAVPAGAVVVIPGGRASDAAASSGQPSPQASRRARRATASAFSSRSRRARPRGRAPATPRQELASEQSLEEA
jgi:hypothetical protein